MKRTRIERPGEGITPSVLRTARRTRIRQHGPGDISLGAHSEKSRAGGTERIGNVSIACIELEVNDSGGILRGEVLEIIPSAPME